MGDYGMILMFTVVGAGFVIVSLCMSWALRPSKPSPEKLSTYECGEEPFGDARHQFNFRYYIFALLFVVFDVESIFIFPWAVQFKTVLAKSLEITAHGVNGILSGGAAFIEMAVFIFILVLGLMYAWRKGALKWE